MYGTRYDRGDDRGQTSNYRSASPSNGSSGGSRISGAPEGRVARRGDRDGEPAGRGWFDEPSNGWREEPPRGWRDDPPAYGAVDLRPTDYRSGEYGMGSYRSGYGGNGVAEYRRRPPGEEYVPRRSASLPRRAANEPPRRAANEPPSRGPDSGRRTPAGEVRPKRKRRPMPLWQEMPLLLIVAFCLAVLIRTFLVQAFFIPSGSMTDTLLIGDRVLVNKVVYDTREPRRGEIVVFSGTDSWVPEVPPEPNLGVMAKLGRTVGDLVGVSRPGDKDFIKRVIGLPGDKVSCCDPQGRVLVNGRPLDEPYVIENSPLDTPPNARECRSRRFEEVTVEPGQMFVMGDHRLVSQDARCQGPVPIDNVIGKAFVIVWPNEHWARLPTPSTFDDVPDPVAAAQPDTAPLTEPPIGVFGIVLPILLALGFPARTRRNFLLDRRRLAE
jgi:signal peptidase I